MQYTRLIFAVKSLLCLAISLIASGCAKTNAEEVETASVSTSETQILSLKGHYDEALALAQEWHSDAYLQSASATARQENQSRPLILSYSFFSEKKYSEALLIWISEDMTIQTKTINISASMEDRRELRIEARMLDSTEALHIAQERRGNEYINTYSSVDIDVFLEYQKGLPDDDTMIWRVAYSRPDGEGNIYILINALNGNIVYQDE